MPSPLQLAALGPVLCLYRTRPGGELSGWAEATRAAVVCEVDSEGLCECVWFYDRSDHCCWRLYLLPDSDSLAWEYLVAGLPVQPLPTRDGGIGQRLWSRLAQRLRGERWQASLLRFHLPRTGPGFGCVQEMLLAATLTTVSPLGAATARRLAKAEGLEDQAPLDDCCCQHLDPPSYSDACVDDAYMEQDSCPLIRLRPEEAVQ